MLKVPLLDLAKQNGAVAGELSAAFERVLKSTRYVMGPELENFERDAAAVFDAKHGVGVSSGTDALLLALMVLGIGPGDEVLVPAFTFFATAGAVSRTGAAPVWVDSDPYSFNMDFTDAASKVSSKTRAIIPVHLFGRACDMDALDALLAKHPMAVVEDCAQSMGATFKKRPVGAAGTFGATSFFPSKNLGGFGDSGLLVTNDDALAERARILRVHGMEPKYHHKFVGANFRMDPLQAALLAVKLPLLSGYNAARAGNAAHYDAALNALPGVSRNTASAPAGARILTPVDPDGGAIWNQYTLRVTGGRRDSLRARLTANDIGADVYYPVTLDRQECYAGIGRGRESLAGAHRLSGEVLSIPVFPELEPAQRDAVVAVIAGWLRDEVSA